MNSVMKYRIASNAFFHLHKMGHIHFIKKSDAEILTHAITPLTKVEVKGEMFQE